VQNQIAFCLLLHLVDAVEASIEHAAHGLCSTGPMAGARAKDDPDPWEMQAERWSYRA
jgi:hypothetical protein